MPGKIRVVVVGVGQMGSTHARAYHRIKDFELAGLVDTDRGRCSRLSAELGGIALFSSLKDALAAVKPQAVAVCTYPDTHKQFILQSLRGGAHVFTEKPLAATVRDAQSILKNAREKRKKVVIGYILRHNPSWIRFIEQARQLGKPLVMRMNLNQQSNGPAWQIHKNLLRAMSPIVDCGVHYVDVMCQMTRSEPVQVQAMGVRLSDEIQPAMYNYGILQVKFADGSVGWYEAGWGPMMSETAHFVKDVVGPAGSVSVVEPVVPNTASGDIQSHTQTHGLLIHHAGLDQQGRWQMSDQVIDTSNEPDHQELCNREQLYFLKSIREDLDLSEHWRDALNSLRIVLAADRSVQTGRTITLRTQPGSKQN
jgi:predicted dehydrogenase